MTSRRRFVRSAAVAGVGLPALGAVPLIGDADRSRPHGGSRLRASGAAPHPLRILILGGTSFLGPHQIAHALGRGHSISIFTRGQTEPTVHRALYARVEHLVGDRADDLGALETGTWDAVIDNSGRRVEWTTDAAELLRDRVGLYVYTSSTGVYYPYLGSDIGEDTELAMDVPEGQSEDGAYTYGVMKARSEAEARRIFGEDRTIVVRPAYIMGPADRTDRFSYWPVRLSRGGEVLVPGRADDPVQYIDVRDLTAWMIRLIENGTTGTFNGAGPASPQGMHPFVYGAHAAFSSGVEFVMVDDHDFLREHRVGFAVPWIMPTGNNAGSARVNIERAVEAGLTYTPLANSVRDVYDWWHSDAVDPERRERMISGPQSLMAREADIIAAWRARG